MKEKIKNSFFYKKLSESKKKKINNIYHRIKKDKFIKQEGDYYINETKAINKLSISFIIPQPIIGSGGHRNIYRIVRFLANEGYNVTCYIDPEGIGNKEHVYSGIDAHNKIKENFFDLGCNIIFDVNNIKECDILFATHAASAYIVKQNEKKYKGYYYDDIY